MTLPPVADPQRQEVELFLAVTAWEAMLPEAHFVALLEGEFFPKWLQVNKKNQKKTHTRNKTQKNPHTTIIRNSASPSCD